ncbi:MAG: asparagine synthase-related protein [Thiobacillus sp.]|nr:asparagine synthase-related protein [Thiobacillus sp.]
MARQLVPLDNAARDGFDSGSIALRARTAPWINQAIAHDPASGTRLILLGHAWLGTRDIAAATLLQQFLRDGEIAFTHLGGSFGVLVWLPQTETLMAVTDRLATQKIYVCNAGETTLLATGLRALLGHPQAPREIDAAAVGQFLITSHLVDTRSLIRDVSVLPPAALTRIDRSGMSVARYWSPRIAAAQDDGLDKWADRLADVLAPAVRARCADAPPLLPLSGGLDSRSVAAFIPPHLAAAATACSFGHRHCHDVRYGRRIARALGARFTRLSIPEDFFKHYLEPVQMLCDGEVSIEALPMYRLIGMGQPGQTMLTGYLGDALSGGHLLGADSTLDTVWRKKYQGKGFSESLLERVLLPERYQAIRGGTHALIRAALEQADAATLDEKALAVELHHRQSRYIAYFGRMLGSRYRVETPFLDQDVLDTFLSMPLVHRQGQRAYRRMLVRHAPRLAAVPENKTRRPVTCADAHGMPPVSAKNSAASPLPAGLQWRLNALHHTLGELLVSLSAGWLGPHNRDYYVHHDESIRRVDPAWFRTRLLDSPFAADWFNLPALEKLLEEHLSRKQDHSIRINNIVAFLAWRETGGL